MVDMAGDASRLGQEASDVADEARRNMSGAAGRAKELIKDARDTAMEYGQHGYDAARDSAMQVKDKTQTYIKEYPWYAIGIAAGVGLLVGLALSRGGRD